ncbi:MAG: hypothetical protein J3K34DRAFT_229892 [Monoraphidium minutum]|nr:MAG: hypothetical protein J3K34DRAFT_229892 [Monoraphidium minutum]
MAALPALSDLGLFLRTWGCEHLDVLVIEGLEGLTRLRRLAVTVTGTPGAGALFGGGGGGSGGEAGRPGLQQLRLALPAAAGAAAEAGAPAAGEGGAAAWRGCEEIDIGFTGVLVVRGSRALACARSAAALARAVVFEEDAPATAPGGDGGGAHRWARGRVSEGSAEGGAVAVRAPAAVVVGALPELWPDAQVWEGPLLVVPQGGAPGLLWPWTPRARPWWAPRGARARRRHAGWERPLGAQLLCSRGERDAALARLEGVLSEGAAEARWGKLTRLC